MATYISSVCAPPLVVKTAAPKQLWRPNSGSRPIQHLADCHARLHPIARCARRLQIQERVTYDTALAIDDAVQPDRIAVFIEAEHGWMTLRGVRAHSSRIG
ncbi:MAG: hypothetical protein E5W70_09325 [Mesorhizobium sp.]|nr:MAG: hypothetical protein E5W70_09325 [Mesorhizobium sp.]TKB28887.1 MAG: hypothetical protein E5W69_06140 [Mesorhizobium sp.]